MVVILLRSHSQWYISFTLEKRRSLSPLVPNPYPRTPPPLIFKAKMPDWLLSHSIRKSHLRTHYISRGSMGRVIEALYGKLGPSENIKKQAVFWGSLGFGIRELLKF